MPLRTAVYIVLSPRPRVGRTLLARLLADFFVGDARNVAAFDLNAELELAQFMPGRAQAATVTDIGGQMALFDRLIAQDNVTKVVDVGPAALGDFLDVARRTDFADEARRRGIAPVFLFVTAPDAVSAEIYAGLARDFPQAIRMPVHNEAGGKGQHRDKFPSGGASAVPLQIPLLSPGLRKYIEQRPFSFSGSTGEFLLKTPLDAQFQLQRWVRQVFLGFREMELRILLGDLQGSLQLPDSVN